MKVEAYLNHGRWVVDCPKCKKLGSTLAEKHFSSPYYAENGKYVCPNCYPGMVVIKSRTGGVKFNEDSRSEALKRAELKCEIYDVVFPKEKKEIEKIVSVRRLDNQNWQPGETIKFLQEENKILGV